MTNQLSRCNCDKNKHLNNTILSKKPPIILAYFHQKTYSSLNSAKFKELNWQHPFSFAGLGARVTPQSRSNRGIERTSGTPMRRPPHYHRCCPGRAGFGVSRRRRIRRKRILSAWTDRNTQETGIPAAAAAPRQRHHQKGGDEDD